MTLITTYEIQVMNTFGHFSTAKHTTQSTPTDTQFDIIYVSSSNFWNLQCNIFLLFECVH